MKSTHNVKVPCSCCRGTGCVELTGEYLVTYRKLLEVGEQTGAALAAMLGTKPTAMNNRLAALERLGLATSRRWGRKRLFTALPQSASKVPRMTARRFPGRG